MVRSGLKSPRKFITDVFFKYSGKNNKCSYDDIFCGEVFTAVTKMSRSQISCGQISHGQIYCGEK